MRSTRCVAEVSTMRTSSFCSVVSSSAPGSSSVRAPAEDAVERIAQLGRDQRRGSRCAPDRRPAPSRAPIGIRRDPAAGARAGAPSAVAEIADLVVRQRHHRAIEAARAAAELVERGGHAGEIARGAAADERADAERGERDEQARDAEAEHHRRGDGRRRHRGDDDAAVDEAAHGAGQRATADAAGVGRGHRAPRCRRGRRRRRRRRRGPRRRARRGSRLAAPASGRWRRSRRR